MSAGVKEVRFKNGQQDEIYPFRTVKRKESAEEIFELFSVVIEGSRNSLTTKPVRYPNELEIGYSTLLVIIVFVAYEQFPPGISKRSRRDKHSANSKKSKKYSREPALFR